MKDESETHFQTTEKTVSDHSDHWQPDWHGTGDRNTNQVILWFCDQTSDLERAVWQ
jgi:hypothetical protein